MASYWGCLILLLIQLYSVDGREFWEVNDGDQVKFFPNETLFYVSIAPLASARFTLVNIPTTATHVTFQLHAQSQPITVSLTEPPLWDSAVTRRNAGVVTLLQNGVSSVTWFVTGDNYTTRALVSAMLYTGQDPVPGGCNLEFNLENDPNVHSTVAGRVNTIQFQYGNFGPGTRVLPPTVCEDMSKNWKSLRYDVYQYFMTERNLEETEFFNSIEKMISADSVQKYGKKVFSMSHGEKKSMLPTAAYAAQGVIYSVIIRHKDGNSSESSAVYVPAAQYDWDFNGNKPIYDVSTQVAVIVLGVAGLFICFFGHRFLLFEMFFIGFVVFLMLSYIIVTRFTGLEQYVRLIIGAVIGVVGGALWLVLWWCAGLPALSVLLVGLLLGFVVSSIVFNITPFGLMQVWTSAFNYGMAFACVVLIVPVLLLACTKKLNIIGCSVIGSYCALLAVDIYVGTSLSMVLFNTLLKATIPGYTSVYAFVPFQSKDIFMYSTWVILSIGGAAFQFYRERKNPDFPQGRPQRRSLMRQYSQIGSRCNPEERERLLAQPEGAQGSYGTMHDPTQLQRGDLNDFSPLAQAQGEGHATIQQRNGLLPRQPTEEQIA